MIQNLNAGTIFPYGQLPAHDIPLPEQLLHAEKGQAAVFYQSAQPVQLAPDKGMAVFQLLRDGGAPVSFYLDKPVQLKPDTAFAVLPLDEACSVRCRSAEPLTAVQAQAMPPQSPHCELNVLQLCTFFPQEHAPGFFFAGEQHHACELIYVRRGVLHTLAGGQDYVLRQNETLILPPDVWHVQFGAQEQSVSFIIISFFPARPLPEGMLLKCLPEHKSTAKLMGQMLEEWEKQRPYCDDMLLSLLQNLLVGCARQVFSGRDEPLQTPNALRNENKILDRAVQYIAQNVSRKITVESLARHCSVSTAYLSVLFHRHLDTSPGAYMIRVRLEESRQLIRSGVGNMAEIARELHFSSAPHFSAAFKHQYGLTPTAYAKGLK